MSEQSLLSRSGTNYLKRGHGTGSKEVVNDAESPVEKLPEYPNYFLLSHYNTLMGIFHLEVREFIAAYALVAVPLWLTLQLSAIYPITADGAPWPHAPIIGLAVGATVFIIYSTFPGVTGDPVRALQNFLAEFYCEQRYSDERDPEHRHRAMAWMLFVVKLIVTWIVQFSGSFLAVLTVIYLTPSIDNHLMEPKRSVGFTNGSGRVLLVVFLVYGATDFVFNKRYRYSPHGHSPVMRAVDNLSGAAVLGIAYAGGITLVYSNTGSTLFFLRSLAPGAVLNSTSNVGYDFQADMYGQFLGGLAAFGYILFTWQRLRWLKTSIRQRSLEDEVRFLSEQLAELKGR